MEVVVEGVVAEVEVEEVEEVEVEGLCSKVNSLAISTNLSAALDPTLLALLLLPLESVDSVVLRWILEGVASDSREEEQDEDEKCRGSRIGLLLLLVVMDLVVDWMIRLEFNDGILFSMLIIVEIEAVVSQEEEQEQENKKMKNSTLVFGLTTNDNNTLEYGKFIPSTRSHLTLTHTVYDHAEWNCIHQLPKYIHTWTAQAILSLSISISISISN